MCSSTTPGGAHGLDPVTAGKDADWETTFQTNVLGLLRMTRAALPLLPRNDGASIINIGSIAGRTAYAGASAYCAAKHGELAITQPATRTVWHRHSRRHD